ncbi:MAG: Ig-like domain-containing protein [Acidobacteriota bacterium]
MKKLSPDSTPSNRRVFIACLLSFAILITPIAAIAAPRSGVGPKVRKGSVPPTKTTSSAEELFVNPPPAIGITATKNDSYPSSPGNASPGEVITYDVDVTNTTGFDALGVGFTDTIDANTTFVPGSLKVSPLALNDTYSATQNTPLNVGTPGVLSNDTGLPGPTAVPIAAGPTTAGGTVTLNANGSFTYTPPNAAFTGADTFTYTATNGQAPPNPGVDNVATVTINVDAAPTVQSTTPADNAVNQKTDTAIGITFSEPVNVTGSWFTISCSVSGAHTAVVGGGPTTYTLTPNTGFTQGETCTVTVVAAQVTDVDTNDPPDTMVADYVFDFTMDAAPSVSSTTPTNGATNVATNSTITLNFSESVSLGATPVTISCATSGAHTSLVTASPNTTFTVTPAVAFAQNELCTITVLAAQVSDTDANDPPNNMVADYVFSFTTDAAPSVTSTTPTNGATNVATNSTITLNFSESVSLGATPVTISCTTSGAHTSGVTASPNTTFTVTPTVVFVGGETCTVTVLAAQVTDTDGGDPPDNMNANFVFSFSTDAAPTVTATTPTNGATNVANNANISLTFSESVNLGATPVTISCATSGAHTSVVSTANPNTTFTVNPDTDFANGELCTVTVLAAQVTDNDANDPPDNMTANFVFSFTTDSPPSVSSTTPTNGALNQVASTNITITFSENVNVTGNWFQIVCGSQTKNPGDTAVTGGPLTFTINPTTDLLAGNICQVTVFAAQVADQDTGDPPDNMTADFVFSFSVPPVAVNDNYNPGVTASILGNVGVNTANSSNFSVLTNDTPSTGVTINQSGSSTQGGTVVMAADGKFSYIPPVGYEGADSFTYTITNASGTSNSATVSLIVSGMIWFINAAAGAGNGRLATPFNSVASFQAINTNAGGTTAGNGDNIFIYENASAYTGPITLLSNQKLIGQDATATLAAIAGVTVPLDSFPLPAMNPGAPATTLNSSAAGVNAVNLNAAGTGNTVRGLTITTGSGTSKGINGTSFGTLTTADLIISGSGPALDLTTGSLSGSFNSISSSGGANGIRLSAIGGSSTLGTGALSGATAEEFFITGANSTVTLTYDGTISTTAAASRPVSISGKTTSGNVTFNGAVSGTGNGVLLDNNDGATITFRGGLTLTTTINTAFSAINGGTIEVCDENPCNAAATGALVNTITTTTGTGLNVNATTISANKLEFRSISANGAASGIVLNTTGASGGLLVKGNSAGLCGGQVTVNAVGTPATVTAPNTADCTGGTIQNTTSHGVSLTSAPNVSLTRMYIHDNTGNGVSISGSSAVSLASCFIQDTTDSGIKGFSSSSNFSFTNGTVENSGTNTLIPQTANIAFNNDAGGNETNITGTFTVTGSSLKTSFVHGISVKNFAGTLSDVNVSSNSIISTNSTATSKGTGIQINPISLANLTKATINQNTVLNFPSDAGVMVLCGNAVEGGTVTTCGSGGANLVNITNNTLSGENAVNGFGTQGILFNENGTGTGNFNVSGNNVKHTTGNSISHNVFGDATVTTTINGNTVVSNNCCLASSGIAGGTSDVGGFVNNTPTLTVTITNNNVSATDGNGILMVARDAEGGHLNISIKTNTVAAPGGGVRPGIRVDAGNSGLDNDVCLDISGNTSAGSGGTQGIGLRKEGTSTTVNAFGIEGMVATATPGIEAFVNGQNPAGGGTLLISATSGFSNCATAPLRFAPGGVMPYDTGLSTGFNLSQCKTANDAPSADGFDITSWRRASTSFGSVSNSLNQQQLDLVVSAAIERWAATDLTAQQLAELRALKFEIADLQGSYLGAAKGNRILVDRDAEGKGWFVDSGPMSNASFGNAVSGSRFYANPMAAPAGHVDLLTAIEHEMGHKLGLNDLYAERDRDSIMYGYLTVGERRVPAKGQAANAQASSLSGTHFLTLKDGKKTEGSKQKAVSSKNHAGTSRAATAPVSGETVTHTIGALPAGKAVRITFQVTVDSPFLGPNQVSNQGAVAGTLNAVPFNIVTNDPGTGAADDATITPVTGVAVANDDNYNAFKNTPLNIPAPGVLANDSGGPTVSAVGGCADVTDPFSGCATTAGGTVTVNGNGSFTYTPPNATFTGPDSFSYTATNASNSDTATVNITVLDTSAIFINEVLFNPPGTDAPNEYIELRGTPSSVIPAGTYFVAIEGDAADNPGDVQTIINLSGLTFGSNGFLVLLQNGNTYTTAAGATVVTSTTTGFGGLPGSRWSADGAATDIEDASVSFMLIQTGVAPTLADDIDADNNGLTDGTVFPGWSVRDSINAMNGSANARAYGAFGYRNVAGSGSSLGAEVIVPFIPSYVGRVCDSTGSTAADWVSSGVLGGAAPNWTLGSAGETEPASFAGKALNHIGASNFANLAPVNSVPGAQNVNEDATLTFNAGNANLISISDPDAGGAAVKVTLTATNATMSLSGTAGLTFTPPSGSNDGTNDTQMIFTGTIANINAALNGMTFTPTPNFFSPPNATLTILTEDQGNTGCGGNKTDSDLINITVNPVNDAPSFNTLAGNPPAVNEDAGAQTVNGFATGMSQGPGESGQTLTFNVSPVSSTGNIAFSSGPAIDATTGNLTYTTSADTNGTATFSVTLSDNGGGTNTSAPQQFTITVNAVNDAPTFQIPSNPPAVNEDAPAQTVNGFATNFQPGPVTATDEGGQTLVGYTVTANGTTGNLTFTSGPSINNAGQLTYTPTANTSGTATFNVVATDSGSGVAPNVNQSAPVPFTITVNGQNDAPVLDNSGNMSLTAINEDVPPASNPGTLVSDIIASAGGDRITDADAGALEGIAVTAVDNTNGTWQFSIDNGTNWTPFGSPNTTTARLLAANANTRVRFLPNLNFNGTVDPGITFRAWDQTSGANGGTADTTVNGTTTAFSTATETASITVNAVNDNPTTIGIPPVSVNEDAADTVIDLRLYYNDVEDGPAGLVYTITGNTNPGLFTSVSINNANDNLTLDYAPNASGAAQLTIRGTDSGGLFIETTLNVTVNAINDPPSFTKGADQTVNEDAGAQTVPGWATSISQGPGESGQTLTFNVSVGGTTGNIAFSSAPAIDPTTGTLTYTTSADTNGTATINVSLSDNGSNVPPNSNTSAVQQFTITVNAVNDAPTFQIPSNPATVNEDAGAQTVNGFATNFQPGPATATDEVGQTLVGYTVTQTGTTGNLAFSSGPSINNAGQLSYTPSANTSGTATFNAVATDSGSGTAPNVNQSAPISFTITVNAVNDAPVLDNTGNMSLTAIDEDVPAASNPGTLVSDIILSAGGDRITDVDSGAVEGIAVIAVDNTNGTWQFSIDNGTNWTAFGAPDALNARLLAANALTRVRFLPNLNFNGTVDPGLTFRAWDQTSGVNGNTADVSTNGSTTAFSTATETASITVNPVNDNPTTTGIPAVSVNEDAADTVLDLRLSFNDVEDGAAGLVYTVQANTNPGLFTSVSINNANDNLTLDYAPNANGVALITIRGTDTGGLFVDTTFMVTVNAVNDAPSFTKGPDITIQDPTPQSFPNWATNISAGPPDESGQTLTFLVSNNANGLFATQPAISPTGTLTFTAQAGQDGVATVTVQLIDNGGTLNGGVDASAPQTFILTVHALNNPPTLDAIADLTINEDAPLQTVNLTGITPGPSFENNQTLTITAVSNNTALIPNPTVNYTNPNTTGSLSFTPVANINGSATITVTVKDTGGTANGGVDTFVRTFLVTVNSVNDAPSFTKGPNQTVNEDAGAQTVNNWATAISPGPANESGQTVNFEVTGNTSPGLFSVAPAISSTGTLTYTPAANANGTATITIVLKDNGGTANGGVDTSAPQTFTITVNSINDAPVNNVPGPQNTTVNALLVFSAGTGNAISISDVDAGSDALQVTIKATDGTITLNGTAGLSFTVGDGTDDPLMTFTGSLTNINAALAGMKNLALGTGVITITTNDLGHNGTGGALTDVDTIQVTVADNLAPVILTIPGTDKAIAFDSVTLVTDPFHLMGSNNFTADHRTHITIFALHSQLRPGETFTAITAEADVAGTTIPLIVESVNGVPNFDWLTQIVIKFPDGFSTGGGGPHDAKIKITLRGQSSNQAVIIVVPAPRP